MANSTAIKRRIRSVTSTRQITKAMELVAASKLRAAATTAVNAEDYREQLDAVLALTAADADWKLHPLVRPVEDPSLLIVIIASDRGLAGAYHSRLEAKLRQIVQDQSASGMPIRIAAVGLRAAAMAGRLEGVELVNSYSRLNIAPSLRSVRNAASDLIERRAAGEFDRVIVINTRYFSPLKQEVMATELFPLKVGSSSASAIAPITLEPDAETAIAAAAEAWVQAVLLDAATNAVASEHAMRMVAMKSATDNAGDLIDELTLEYNSARQAAITQELAEISGGVAALS